MTNTATSTIPADDFLLCGDTAWWIVPGPSEAGGWIHLYDRPCDDCLGVGLASAELPVFDAGSACGCVDGRHTFEIEVATFDLRCDACGSSASLPLEMECYSHAPKPIVTPLRVSVVPDMVLELVDDGFIIDGRYLEMVDGGEVVLWTPDPNIDDHKSTWIGDRILPPGARPGRWAVQLKVAS